MIILNKTHGPLALFIGLCALFALIACNSNTNNQPSSDKFSDSIAEANLDLNSGITIQKSFPAEKDTEELVSLIILNHTDEDIHFKNSGFGLQLFCKDKKSNIWQKQNMPDEFVEENRVIPQKTETLNTNLIDINVVNINRSTVSQVSCTELRVYIQGISQETGKKYGAYADIKIDL